MKPINAQELKQNWNDPEYREQFLIPVPEPKAPTEEKKEKERERKWGEFVTDDMPVILADALSSIVTVPATGLSLGVDWVFPDSPGVQKQVTQELMKSRGLYNRLTEEQKEQIDKSTHYPVKTEDGSIEMQEARISHSEVDIQNLAQEFIRSYPLTRFANSIEGFGEGRTAGQQMATFFSELATLLIPFIGAVKGATMIPKAGKYIEKGAKMSDKLSADFFKLFLKKNPFQSAQSRANRFINTGTSKSVEALMAETFNVWRTQRGGLIKDNPETAEDWTKEIGALWTLNAIVGAFGGKVIGEAVDRLPRHLIKPVKEAAQRLEDWRQKMEMSAEGMAEYVETSAVKNLGIEKTAFDTTIDPLIAQTAAIQTDIAFSATPQKTASILKINLGKLKTEKQKEQALTLVGSNLKRVIHILRDGQHLDADDKTILLSAINNLKQLEQVIQGEQPSLISGSNARIFQKIYQRKGKVITKNSLVDEQNLDSYASDKTNTVVKFMSGDPLVERAKKQEGRWDLTSRIISGSVQTGQINPITLAEAFYTGLSTSFLLEGMDLSVAAGRSLLKRLGLSKYINGRELADYDKAIKRRYVLPDKHPLLKTIFGYDADNPNKMDIRQHVLVTGGPTSSKDIMELYNLMRSSPPSSVTGRIVDKFVIKPIAGIARFNRPAAWTLALMEAMGRARYLGFKHDIQREVFKRQWKEATKNNTPLGDTIKEHFNTNSIFKRDLTEVTDGSYNLDEAVREIDLKIERNTDNAVVVQDLKLLKEALLNAKDEFHEFVGRRADIPTLQGGGKGKAIEFGRLPGKAQVVASAIEKHINMPTEMPKKIMAWKHFGLGGAVFDFYAFAISSYRARMAIGPVALLHNKTLQRLVGTNSTQRAEASVEVLLGAGLATTVFEAVRRRQMQINTFGATPAGEEVGDVKFLINGEWVKSTTMTMMINNNDTFRKLIMSQGGILNEEFGLGKAVVNPNQMTPDEIDGAVAFFGSMGQVMTSGWYDAYKDIFLSRYFRDAETDNLFQWENFKELAFNPWTIAGFTRFFDEIIDRKTAGTERSNFKKLVATYPLGKEVTEAITGVPYATKATGVGIPHNATVEVREALVPLHNVFNAAGGDTWTVNPNVKTDMPFNYPAAKDLLFELGMEEAVKIINEHDNQRLRENLKLNTRDYPHIREMIRVLRFKRGQDIGAYSLITLSESIGDILETQGSIGSRASGIVQKYLELTQLDNEELYAAKQQELKTHLQIEVDEGDLKRLLYIYKKSKEGSRIRNDIKEMVEESVDRFVKWNAHKETEQSLQ